LPPPVSALGLATDDRLTMEVRSSDLDLTRDADVRRLERRVAIATRRVCDVGGRTMEALAWRSACIAQTRQQAAVRIGQVVAAARLPVSHQLSAR
jgi:UrcA family protein